MFQPQGHRCRLCPTCPGDRSSHSCLFPFRLINEEGRHGAPYHSPRNDQPSNREQSLANPGRGGQGLPRPEDHTTFRALDGIVIKKKTGIRASARPVLVALRIRPDGKKEFIDFRLAKSESGPKWRTFLNDLYRRGLKSVEVICDDGGQGLISILPEVYPNIPLQRCWAHKARNILDKVPRKKQSSVKRGLQKIYAAKNLTEVQTSAARWTRSWKDTHPKAVKCLHDDMEDLLTCFQFTDLTFRKAIRTTNAIERRFREVRRRTRPMGVFSNRTSIERVLYAAFM
jgi:putative transposase